MRATKEEVGTRVKAGKRIEVLITVLISSPDTFRACDRCYFSLLCRYARTEALGALVAIAFIYAIAAFVGINALQQIIAGEYEVGFLTP